MGSLLAQTTLAEQRELFRALFNTVYLAGHRPTHPSRRSSPNPSSSSCSTSLNCRAIEEVRTTKKPAGRLELWLRESVIQYPQNTTWVELKK